MSKEKTLGGAAQKAAPEPPGNADRSRAAEADRAAASERAVGISGRTFLVLEDNTFLLQIIVTYLEMRGATAVPAENGEVGLRKYFEAPERYDALLADIHMPIVDGNEVARRIRVENGKIPILAMSGEVAFADLDSGVFSAYLRKPFEMERLLAALIQILQ